MSDKKKLYILFNLIACLWYTLLEDPLADQILLGSWKAAFKAGDFIPSYLIGIAVTFLIPCEKHANLLTDTLFPDLPEGKKRHWIFLFFYAALFEFWFGAAAKVYFVFIAPDGDRSVITALRMLFKPYFPLLILNMLISHFFLKPSEDLAKRILRQK